MMENRAKLNTTVLEYETWWRLDTTSVYCYFSWRLKKGFINNNKEWSYKIHYNIIINARYFFSKKSDTRRVKVSWFIPYTACELLLANTGCNRCLTQVTMITVIISGGIFMSASMSYIPLQKPPRLLPCAGQMGHHWWPLRMVEAYINGFA